MEIHPDYVAPDRRPAPKTLLYRVNKNQPLAPGELIEAVVIARNSDLALEYLKVSTDYVANMVPNVECGPGIEGQVIMARYVPEDTGTLNIYNLSLVKNIRNRCYYHMIVVAASELLARGMLPEGMSRSQSLQFGWNEDQSWSCTLVGTAAPDFKVAQVLSASQKW